MEKIISDHAIVGNVIMNGRGPSAHRVHSKSRCIEEGTRGILQIFSLQKVEEK